MRRAWPPSGGPVRASAADGRARWAPCGRAVVRGVSVGVRHGHEQLPSGLPPWYPLGLLLGHHGAGWFASEPLGRLRPRIRPPGQLAELNQPSSAAARASTRERSRRSSAGRPDTPCPNHAPLPSFATWACCVPPRRTPGPSMASTTSPAPTWARGNVRAAAARRRHAD